MTTRSGCRSSRSTSGVSGWRPITSSPTASGWSPSRSPLPGPRSTTWRWWRRRSASGGSTAPRAPSTASGRCSWLALAGKGSVWAASNRERVARLEREGRMRPAGRAVVERAQADGSWSVLIPAERGEIPDDLASVFASSPGRGRPGTVSRRRCGSRRCRPSTWRSGRRPGRGGWPRSPVAPPPANDPCEVILDAGIRENRPQDGRFGADH